MTDNRSAKLETVRALLAKAECSTVTPEEARAFFEGAQRLMAKFAIEEAEIREQTHSTESPTHRLVPIVKPYAIDKMMLLNVVARANVGNSQLSNRKALTS